MHIRLCFLVTWPPREVLEHNVPPFIKQLYPTCRCIIDCSEVFIETPADFDACAEVYSNHKHHSTIEFLIRITPCGTISYVSHAWGGRVSDKNLTQQSDFLQYVEPGDTILADRRFNIYDDISIHSGTLIIPAFTRVKTQLQRIIYLGWHRSLLRKTSTPAMQILLLAQKTAIRFSARARVQGAVPVGVN